MWFGLITFCTLILPMLFLPGRLSAAYLYVPLIGAAICIAALVEWQPKPVLAALILLWIPWNFVNLRWLRSEEILRAGSVRVYVATLIKAIKMNPGIRTFFYHDTPMEPYMISSVVNFVQPDPVRVKVIEVNAAEAPGMLQTTPAMLLDWEDKPVPGSLAATAHKAAMPESSYLKMDRRMPFWQLESGWNLSNRGDFRWIAPTATAKLLRPPHATQFEIAVFIPGQMLRYVHRSHLRVSLDGHLIGEHDFEQPGVKVLRWKVDDSAARSVQVSIEALPGFRTAQGDGPLGMLIGDFGFAGP
jgi:hypothetical protein